MARGATAAELAVYTGRAVDDPRMLAVMDPALRHLDRYYQTSVATAAELREAHLAMCRWMLQAGKGELTTDEFGGVTYLPRFIPAVDKMLRRRGGFA